MGELKRDYRKTQARTQAAGMSSGTTFFKIGKVFFEKF